MTQKLDLLTIYKNSMNDFYKDRQNKDQKVDIGKFMILENLI